MPHHAAPVELQKVPGRPTDAGSEQAGERDVDGNGEAVAQAAARAGPEPCSSFSRCRGTPRRAVPTWQARKPKPPRRHGRPAGPTPEPLVSVTSTLSWRPRWRTVMEGVEPSTVGLSVRCSTRLSYISGAHDGIRTHDLRIAPALCLTEPHARPGSGHRRYTRAQRGPCQARFEELDPLPVTGALPGAGV